MQSLGKVNNVKFNNSLSFVPQKYFLTMNKEMKSKSASFSAPTKCTAKVDFSKTVPCSGSVANKFQSWSWTTQ